jgi:hypothetical protein
MAVRLSALTQRLCSTPQKHYFSASGTHFCYRLSKPQALVRLARYSDITLEYTTTTSILLFVHLT